MVEGVATSSVNYLYHSNYSLLITCCFHYSSGNYFYYPIYLFTFIYAQIPHKILYTIVSSEKAIGMFSWQRRFFFKILIDPQILFCICNLDILIRRTDLHAPAVICRHSVCEVQANLGSHSYPQMSLAILSENRPA